MAIKKYTKELPGDMVGQKTTAIPIENISETEWTTPISIVGATTSIPVNVTFPSTQAVSGTINIGNYPNTQNVSDTNSLAKLTTIDTKLGGTINVSDTTARTTLSAIDTKLGGIIKAQITNFPTQSNSVTVTNIPDVQQVKLTDSNIVLPVEIRGTEREFLFTQTTNLGANAVFISPVYDGILATKVLGIVSPSHEGTLYIQESDDQAVWYVTSSQAIPASTANTISGTNYNTGYSYDKTFAARYVRIVYVNGATAQTRFALSAYASN